MVINKQIIYNDKEYMKIMSQILNNELVLKMKQYRQHFNVNCYDHCLYVSYNAYIKCKKHHLDYISAARAGMLHDLFLYDWRKRENGRKGHHAFTHPKVAYENAGKVIKLNDKEKDIIIKHMWPTTIGLPKYKESYIVLCIDKYFSIKEAFIKDKYKEDIKV